MAEIVIPGGCGCCGPGVSFTNFVFQVWYKLTVYYTRGDDGTDPDEGCWSYASSASCEFRSDVPNDLNANDGYTISQFTRTSLLAIGGGALQGGADNDSLDPNDWITLQTLNAPNATFSPLPDPSALCTTCGPTSYGTRFALNSDFASSFVYGGATYDIIVPAGTEFYRERALTWYADAAVIDDDDQAVSVYAYGLYTFGFNNDYVHRRSNS